MEDYCEKCMVVLCKNLGVLLRDIDNKISSINNWDTISTKDKVSFYRKYDKDTYMLYFRLHTLIDNSELVNPFNINELLIEKENINNILEQHLECFTYCEHLLNKDLLDKY